MHAKPTTTVRELNVAVSEKKEHANTCVSVEQRGNNDTRYTRNN